MAEKPHTSHSMLGGQAEDQDVAAQEPEQVRETKSVPHQLTGQGGSHGFTLTITLFPWRYRVSIYSTDNHLSF